MEISKMLTLSTAHICPSTRKLLNNECEEQLPESNFPFSVYCKMGFGWFIYISDDVDEQSTIPLDLAGCVTAAKNAGCRILCLDSDGPIEKSLLTYEDEY